MISSKIGRAERSNFTNLQTYKRRRDEERQQSINRMAHMEFEAGTYDKVILPEGAEER
jgi:hypothetical protein